uniref:Uncharacterized protein n=1 Tax=Tetranychus urticae TaxID=32264 RepID=T1K7J8_TETUR
MPFTLTFIHEIHRIGYVVANNLLRRASSDTKIGNYNIKKLAQLFNIIKKLAFHRQKENPEIAFAVFSYNCF